MSYSSIMMTYTETVQEADNLEEIAKKINKQYEKMKENMVLLIEGWRGENIEAYLGKMKEQREVLDRIVTNLQGCAGVIRQIAKTTYDTEMRAWEIAQKRQYLSAGEIGGGGGGGGAW